MKLHYNNRIVAFIDVLGFKNLVNSTDLSSIEAYFTIVIESFKQHTTKYGFKFILISDAIVVYCSNTKDNFESVCRSLTILQNQLLLEGIIIRGGISYGDFYVNRRNNVMVGKALIKAFNLESQASYPRIIVDREMISQYYLNTNELIISNSRWIRYSPPAPYVEDFPYLNYTFKVFSRSNNTLPKKLLQFIKSRIYNSANIDKYIWLKAHLIDSIRESLAYNESLTLRNSQWRIRQKNLTKLLLDLTQI